MLAKSGLAHLFGFMRTESESTAFGENFEGADPAAKVSIGSVNVGRKTEPKFDLHLGDVLKFEARELGPGLVGVSVVVEELVGQHEGSDKETELAAILTAKSWVLRFESVDVEEGENDD